MDTETHSAWIHEQDEKLPGGVEEKTGLALDRPFVIGLPVVREDEWEESADQAAPVLVQQLRHFRSQDELMEFVLRVLTEDEVALTQRVMRERS